MANSIDALKIKYARNRLLEALNMVYPTPIKLNSLYNNSVSLDPTYDWTLFEKDIIYLKEKSYVVFSESSFTGQKDFRNKLVKLTPTGKDIADKLIFDPSLEI